MKQSRYWALFVILTLCLVLAWIVLEQAGGPNPIRDAFSYVLSPVQYVVGRVSRPAMQGLGRINRLADLEEQNEALRHENLMLRHELTLLQEARIENETLRRQLNFKSAVPNYQLLSAEVIGHDPSNLLQSLIIDRGHKDGIEVGMPVLAAEGLVGRISETSANSSKVMVLTDPSSSVSSMIQRSRATGLVQGHIASELYMRYIPPGDTVDPGDMVLTSGLGGNFPKRLVIGQVSSVDRQDVQMFQEARIIPAVNLRNLEVVMVLLNFTPPDLAQNEAAP